MGMVPLPWSRRSDQNYPAGIGAVAASDVAHLPWASVDELAHERVLHDTTRHSVGAG